MIFNMKPLSSRKRTKDRTKAHTTHITHTKTTQREQQQHKDNNNNTKHTKNNTMYDNHT